MSKQTKITKSARGQECQVRIPSVCNGNPETVVLAHLNGGGMGMKNPDWQGAYCCSACHDAIDGRASVAHMNQQNAENYLRSIKLMHLEGVIRTQALLIDQRLIKIA